MASSGDIAHVSDTAFLVAAFRAEETARPDALFHDPLAERLIGEEGRAMAAKLPSTRFMGAWNLVIRTVIIDALLAEAIAGGVDTVLNLGAGLDTRPYRLDLPASLRWVEVDFPDVVALKEERLRGVTPQCRLERMSLDLLDLPARRKLLSEACAAAGKVLVLTEGVVPYLPTHDAGVLADDLRAQERIAAWIVDYLSPEVQRYRTRIQQLHQVPFQFEPGDWFVFFAEHGWKVGEMRYIGDEARRLGRPMPLPLRYQLFAALRSLFMSREQREGLRRFAGYAVLEPAEPGPPEPR